MLARALAATDFCSGAESFTSTAHSPLPPPPPTPLPIPCAGSTIKQGERHCVVYATGMDTFFGRAAALLGQVNSVANIQKVMTRIGACCLVTIGVWIIIELSVQFGKYNHSCKGGVGECRGPPCAGQGKPRPALPHRAVPQFALLPALAACAHPLPCTSSPPAPCPPLPAGMCPTLTNMLVIIVGGIPIAMPTVLSVTLALGAYVLAKEGAIVSRMSGERAAWGVGGGGGVVGREWGAYVLASLGCAWAPLPVAALVPCETHPSSRPCSFSCVPPLLPALPALYCARPLPAAVEEMAGMDVLCSDKTGTLTLNKLTVDHVNCYPLAGHSVEEVLKYGAMSANIVTEEPIDMVLHESYPNRCAAAAAAAAAVPGGGTAAAAPVVLGDSAKL